MVIAARPDARQGRVFHEQEGDLWPRLSTEQARPLLRRLQLRCCDLEDIALWAGIPSAASGNRRLTLEMWCDGGDKDFCWQMAKEGKCIRPKMAL